MFYDYLLANLKLYFDKFEEEIGLGGEEPTNQAYDMAKSGEAEDLEAGAEDLEAGEEDLELEL